MAQPFIGEIRMMAFNFAPKGWATCDGQTLSIQQNAALFSILGTTYGGNGSTNFMLPDLRGRVPLSYGNSIYGNNYAIGEKAGEPAHTLTISEMPAHNHLVSANNGTPNAPTAPGNLYSSNPDTSLYQDKTEGGTLDPNAIGLAGGGQPHDNMQPYLVVLFCIALIGIFPSRN